MRGFSGISNKNSACVRFIDASEVHQEDLDALRAMHQQRIKIAYIDIPSTAVSRDGFFGLIADEIGFSSLPPQGEYSGIQLMDHLITSSHREDGLIIIIDGADRVLAKQSRALFDLIELFLIQIHHWNENSKPCYLCFQISKSKQLSAFGQSIHSSKF